MESITKINFVPKIK